MLDLKRREFITLLTGAAVAWPFAARAQQAAPIRPLIGFLSQLSAAAAVRNVAAFRSGLRDLGYVEGGNATLQLRYGDGAPERMGSLSPTWSRCSLTCCSWPARPGR